MRFKYPMISLFVSLSIGKLLIFAFISSISLKISSIMLIPVCFLRYLSHPVVFPVLSPVV